MTQLLLQLQLRSTLCYYSEHCLLLISCNRISSPAAKVTMAGWKIGFSSDLASLSNPVSFAKYKQTEQFFLDKKKVGGPKMHFCALRIKIQYYAFYHPQMCVLSVPIRTDCRRMPHLLSRQYILSLVKSEESYVLVYQLLGQTIKKYGKAFCARVIGICYAPTCMYLVQFTAIAINLIL